MEDDVKTLGDYLSIAWRRKFHILIPLVLILAITVATVFLLPPVYRSTGTVLIESQQIPAELIQSTVTSFADERIQVITQRIMTSQQLFGIIKKFNLYTDELGTTSHSEILEDMRNRVVINRVSADAGQINGRRKGGALIAFTVSFEYHQPRTAQQVANEMITLFLDENIRTRTARAEETSEFLKKESERINAQIAEMEAQIAIYKQENEGSLPESLGINLQRVSSLRSSKQKLETDLSVLEERRKLLLVDLEALKYNVAAGKSGLSEEEQRKKEEQLQQKKELQELQNRFISLSARYGAEHPDVKAIQRQITAFEEEYGNLSDIAELQSQQQTIRQEITELTGNYSSEHPDVKRLERKLEGIDAIIAKSQKPVSVEVSEVQSIDQGPNQEIILAQAKLESIDRNIERIKKALSDVEIQTAELDLRISRTPQVERGLDTLERDYENTKGKYQEMKNKQLQAELSQSLEAEQKGERFTLLEPPLLPDKPVKPNRPKLFLIGLMLSMVSGLGVAGLAEMFDGGIRGSRAFAAITKMTPLVAIPYIVTRNDERVRKRNLRILGATAFILCIGAVAAVHFFYKPLDLLWYIILRKFNLT